MREELETQTLKRSSLSVVNVDTTVQEKAIAFPTDARLYHKARLALVRQAKQLNVPLRQSYTRVGKWALAKQGRYANAQQMQLAKREQRKLRTYLGRIIRDIERKADPAQLQRLSRLLTLARRIHQQQRKDHGKVYSVQAPEMECLVKGKAHKRYEFGVKVGIVSTSEAMKISQEAFADELGVHRTYYGSIERGIKDIRVSTLERVCKGLGIRVSELFQDIEN